MASPIDNHKPVCKDHNYEGGYLPVNADKIEERLNQIWQEANRDSSLPGPVIKLCLANIVVITDNSTRLEAERFSQRLAQLHPSRIILITIDDAPNIYQAFVATSCTLDHETKFLTCWEIIEIGSSRQFAEDVPGAIRSLLIGSVPVITVDFRPEHNTPILDSAVDHLSDYSFYASNNGSKVTGKNRMPFDWFETLPLRNIFSEMYGRLLAINKKLEVQSLTISYDTKKMLLMRLYAGWFIYRLNGSVVSGNSKDGMNIETDDRQLFVEFNQVDKSESDMIVVKLSDGSEIAISELADKNSKSTMHRASHPMVSLDRLDEKLQLEEYILGCTRESCEFEEYLESKLIIEDS